MSLNLHGIVRTAINFNNADETVLLIRSLGNANVQGRIVPTYGEPESVGAQVLHTAHKSHAALKCDGRLNCFRFVHRRLPTPGPQG